MISRQRPVELLHRDNRIMVNDLAVHCELCKDSGWTLDATLTTFMERVLAFLDGNAPHVPHVEVNDDILEVTAEDEPPSAF